MNINGYLKDILGTTTKIATWVKIIALLLFLFCAWMCINYYIQHYPDADVTSKPFDYNGMLVGFFTLLVTLLVGWNIYSTINAKEELDRTKETLTEKYKTDIATMKSEIENLNSQMKDIKNQYEPNENGCKPVSIEIPKYMKDWVDYDILKRGTPLYNWLWNFLGEKTSADDALTEYEKIKASEPKKIAFIDGREASRTELLALIKEMLPIKLDSIKYK